MTCVISIVVDNGGNFDFTTRVSGNGDGAQFHLAIDGGSVTGLLNVPNRNAFDNMTDVTAPGIPLTPGPHVLRLAFDAGATNGPKVGFAGAYNFISIAPSGSPGVFRVAPAAARVRAGGDADLTVTWTVPAGSWHVLNTIDLRFKKRLRGERPRIHAAATDDLGRHSGFETGGSIAVTR